jgi:ABC-type transport system substrate-binding protein
MANVARIADEAAQGVMRRADPDVRSIGSGGLNSAQLMHYLLHTDKIEDGWNSTRYRSRELEYLIEKAVRELDEEKRIDCVGEVLQIVLDQAPGDPKYHDKHPYGVTATLDGTTTWSRVHPLFTDAYSQGKNP